MVSSSYRVGELLESSLKCPLAYLKTDMSKLVAVLDDNTIHYVLVNDITFAHTRPPFPQIDIIGAMVIVWRVRGKIIRSVLCNIVCNNCAQCDAHTNEQTNSSLDWVLSHWAHFTVLRFIFVSCITVCCMHA